MTSRSTVSADAPASEQARDPLASEARVVEWYRVDVSRRMVRVLVPSALVLTVGSLLVSRGFGYGELPSNAVALGIGGLLLVGLGPLAAILGLKRILEAEDYLILRTDGILHHVGRTEMLIRWDDLEEVAWDDHTDGIELRGTSGERFVVRERFAGLKNRELAERLEEVRRKAIWQLLPQQRPRDEDD